VGLADTDIHYYEGLVRTTARMYASGVGVELEDLEQVLRFRVWRALEAYDPQRSRAARRSFVYTCIRNQIKDLVKARVRKKDTGYSEFYLEDVASGSKDERFLAEAPDDRLEEAVLLPTTVTTEERHVLALVYVGFSLTEVGALLGVTAKLAGTRMASVRTKMEDWRPTGTSMSPAAEIFQLASEVPALLEAA
jgi:RNA polymerase sigma factor (sigma-70 family)